MLYEFIAKWRASAFEVRFGGSIISYEPLHLNYQFLFYIPLHPLVSKLL